MQFAGSVNSEETMGGLLIDGRRVYVEMLPLFDDAPEGLRDDPEWWALRVANGEFADEENPPRAWIETPRVRKGR